MEIWDLYTKDRVRTGRQIRRGEPVPAGFCHLVVHICVFNDRGQMLIQQRQPFKDGWPTYWDVSTGGSALAGETSAQAAERELFEEIGLRLDFSALRPSFSVNFSFGFDDFYLVRKNVDLSALTLQPEEVQAVRWADCDEIFDMIDLRLIIPYHRSLISLLFYMRDHRGTLTMADPTAPDSAQQNT